jgi:ABC-type dipeptide/oligopeptide/nickel transport system ATPase component
MALLDVKGLGLSITNRGVSSTILSDVSFSVDSGECVALVGESGSGKSMTTKCIIGAQPAGAVVQGSVHFDDLEVVGAGRQDLLRMRRNDAGMIYQDPRSGINPIQRIGDFLVEAVVTAGSMKAPAARARAVELLKAVRLRDPEELMRRYPFELSGGMLQRVMIVSALMPDPKLLLCDEPTTALDVTNQAEVVSILSSLQKARDLAMIFITHDLDLAAAISDRVCVMKDGRIVEVGTTEQVIRTPQHPYTRALLASRPTLGDDPSRRLPTISESLAAEGVIA